MLDFKVTDFNNGLKLITAPLANTKAVTILFLISVGSRYEEASQNGISHFLEHLFFKGTNKRPTTLDIAKTLDGVGASYNAFTGEEHTGFYVRSASEHFDLALDVLYDLLYNSKFDEAEIEKEKGVIYEEINMYQDMPQSYIVDVAKKLFYGDQSLGRPIVGQKELIKKFQRKDFLTYRDEFYSSSNIVVAVAGGNGHLWQEKISKFFENLPAKKKNLFPKAIEKQEKPATAVFHKKTDQAHMILGFRSIPRIDGRRPILKVLNNLMGENMSSRLFIELREKRGLAYYISSEMADYQDAGVFGAAAGADILRIEETIKVILDEFQKLKTQKVSSEELIRAKENLKGKLYLGLEESFSVADFLATQQLFWEKIEDTEDLIKKYEKITAEDIQKFAQEFFVSKNLNLAIIGPFKEEEKFQKIIERY